MLVSFCCFGVNYVNNRCTRGAPMRQPPKERFYRWMAPTVFGFLLTVFFPIRFKFGYFSVTTGSMQGWLDPAPRPGWHINACQCQKVCCESHHSVKSKKECSRAWAWAPCLTSWSQISISHTLPELINPPLAHSSFHRWERFTLSIWDRCERVCGHCGELHAACSIVQHNWFGCGSREAYLWRDIQISRG